MDPSNTEQRAIDKVIEDSGLETIFLSLDCNVYTVHIYTYIYIYIHTYITHFALLN